MKFRNSSLFDSFPVFLCRIPLVFFQFAKREKEHEGFPYIRPGEFLQARKPLLWTYIYRHL